MNGVGNWFADNVGWLGLVLTLLGVVATLLVHKWQLKPKQLDYRIINDLAVLTEHANPMRDKLKVQYNDIAMADPHIVTIRIQNTGKVAVVREDYVQSIQIHYSNRGSAALDGSIAAESAPSICQNLFDTDGRGPSVEPSMMPELMNPGDWFEAQFVSDGDPGDIEVSCRFKDQSRPMKDMKVTDEVRRQVLVDLAPLGVGIGFLLLGYIAMVFTDSLFALVPIIAGFFVASAVARTMTPRTHMSSETRESRL